MMNAETLFETIYRLAKAGDEIGLREIKAKHCLGIFQGLHNALMLLAKEKQHAAVNLLIKLDGSRNHAAQGYAEGNHDSYVNQQIVLGAHPKWAAKGYAVIGEKTKVEQLCVTAEDHYYAAWGYALGDYGQYIEEQMKTLCSDEKALDLFGLSASKVKLLGLGAVLGYAQANRIDRINQLIAQYKFPSHSYPAIGGLAFGGHENEALNFPTSIMWLEFEDCQATGRAFRGCIDEVKELIRIDEDDEFCFINRRRRGFAGAAYATMEHIDQVNRWLALGDQREYIAYGYEKVSTPNNLLRILVLTPDIELCKLLVEKAKASKEFSSLLLNPRLVGCVEEDMELRSLLNGMRKEAEKINHLLQAGTLIKYATQIQETMQQHQLSFEQAKTWLLPEIPFFFLHVKPHLERQGIPREIILKNITAAIPNFPLSEDEILDLYTKYLAYHREKQKGYQFFSLSRWGANFWKFFFPPTETPSLKVKPSDELPPEQDRRLQI